MTLTYVLGPLGVRIFKCFFTWLSRICNFAISVAPHQFEHFWSIKFRLKHCGFYILSLYNLEFLAFYIVVEWSHFCTSFSSTLAKSASFFSEVGQIYIMYVWEVSTWNIMSFSWMSKLNNYCQTEWEGCKPGFELVTLAIRLAWPTYFWLWWRKKCSTLISKCNECVISDWNFTCICNIITVHGLMEFQVYLSVQQYGGTNMWMNYQLDIECIAQGLEYWCV